MNDDRVFIAKKPWLLLLLDLKMPLRIIREMLDISSSTLNNYLSILQTSRELKNPGTTTSQGDQLILKLFADLKCWPNNFKLPTDFIEKLISILSNALKEDDIIMIMQCSVPAILSFQERRFASDIPIQYQKLINDVCGDYLGRSEDFFFDSDSFARRRWKQYLEDISSEKISLPEKYKFEWRKRHFVRDILKNIADENRKYSVCLITHEVCNQFDKLVDSLDMDQKNVLQDYYGLTNGNNNPGIAKTLTEISIAMNRTRERARQIKEKAIRRMRQKLTRFDIVNPDWKNTFELKARCEGKIAEIKDLNEKYYLSLIAKPDEYSKVIRPGIDIEKEKFLLSKIEDLECSVRALNALNNTDVNYVFQLVQEKEYELFKSRFLGKKGLQEIKDLLANNDCALDTVFSEKESLYFQYMTRD